MKPGVARHRARLDTSGRTPHTRPSLADHGPATGGNPPAAGAAIGGASPISCSPATREAPTKTYGLQRIQRAGRPRHRARLDTSGLDYAHHTLTGRPWTNH